MAKKIITVFGATGAQGGGLVRAIAADTDSEFSVRAVTRDVGSDKAKALAALGAEVVYGDLADAASVHKALEGAYGAFFVTFYWAHFSPEQEKAEAAFFAKAAKDAGIKHAIWSTLEDTRELVPMHDDRMPTLMEKYKVPHFDAKGESNQQFIRCGSAHYFFPCLFLLGQFYLFRFRPQTGRGWETGISHCPSVMQRWQVSLLKILVNVLMVFSKTERNTLVKM